MCQTAARESQLLPVPLIGFARVLEGLDSFGTKVFILLVLHSPSYCSTFLIT